ncbi:MAG: D-alanine--D-alanine ligase family protein [Planctomycetota bacterium]|jgi:D-alanine-D-alanine ligase
MSRKLDIMVLMDGTAVPDNDPEFTQIPAVPTTEHHVIGALRELGHNVSIQPVEEDVGKIVAALTRGKPDLVFNLTEQFAGDRRFDKNIAALLEILDIPFTGSGAMGLMLCRDKRLCKQLLGLHRIRVPGFVSLPLSRPVRVPKTVHYPLVVKPAFEDSSEGISNASLASNEDALQERVRFVHDGWQQAAIAEEYIEGRELYVGVLGNKKLIVLPIRECFFNSDGIGGPQMATYRVKFNAEYRKKWNITFGFAELEAATLKAVERICKRVYRVLQIRDYGRIDLRLTPDNKLVVLEANPNPDIAYGEEVAEAAERGGISYEQLIARILHLALHRYKGKS